MPMDLGAAKRIQFNLFVDPRSRPHPNLPQQFWGRWASNASPEGAPAGPR
jgi:hypothetical protein